MKTRVGLKYFVSYYGSFPVFFFDIGIPIFVFKVSTRDGVFVIPSFKSSPIQTNGLELSKASVLDKNVYN